MAFFWPFPPLFSSSRAHWPHIIILEVFCSHVGSQVFSKTSLLQLDSSKFLFCHFLRSLCSKVACVNLCWANWPNLVHLVYLPLGFLKGIVCSSAFCLSSVRPSYRTLSRDTVSLCEQLSRGDHYLLLKIERCP